VELGLSFGNFFHALRCGLTSFERRFLKEFEESLHAIVKQLFVFFEMFLQPNLVARMGLSPHLHVSMPHVEKLADLFVLLLLPIDALTSLRTIQGGLAPSAVLKLEIRRRYGVTYDAALGHDCAWSRTTLAQCKILVQDRQRYEDLPQLFTSAGTVCLPCV
jgi:hypothetical protein